MEPTYKQGKNIFIETGVDSPDTNPTWYAPMAGKPYAPVFEILATRGTQGRYYPYTYAISVKDLVKFHGHDCEGLSHAAACCRVAFDVLFPEGFIDRSVIVAVTGTSPCYSDVVAYLTGCRIQYGNLFFFKDKRYGHAILLYRTDTEIAVLATWKEGINTIADEPVVLDGKITWAPEVNTKDLIYLKRDIKKGGPSPYQLDRMRYLQWKHINDIYSHPLNESYQAKIIEGFELKDWVDNSLSVTNPIERTDVKFKNYNYRERPISDK